MKKLSTIFIDFDGTLVDSLPLMRSIFTEFMDSYSLPYNDGTFDELNGPTLVEIMAILIDQYKISLSVDALLSRYKAIFLAKYSEANPAVGSLNLLLSAREHSVNIYIVTSNLRTVVSEWLKKWDMDQYIAGIVSAEDIARGKPDPESYFIAINKSGCKLNEVIAVEDSIKGACAALSANIKTYCLKSEETKLFSSTGEGSKIEWIESLNDLRGIFFNSFDKS